jgi:2,3-bisphosphoglycerate-dependent phosphoglycerate mutase
VPLPLVSCLLLVKHALPDIEPEVPAQHWQLGSQGRAQSLKLAEAIRPHRPGVVLTSQEPKAAETGQIVADVLELPRRTVSGLHEQDNIGTPYFDTAEAFGAAVQGLFTEPDKRAYGNESAVEALARFERGVAEALEPHPDETAVIVTHGRVGTLFIAAHNAIDVFAFWKDWPLATFAVLSRPEYRVLEPPAKLGS